MEFILPLFAVLAAFASSGIAWGIIAIALTAVSTVYSYQQQKQAAKDQLKSGGIEITKQDNNAGLTIIYGERAIGGVKVWKHVDNTTFSINPGRTVFGQGDPTDGVGKNFGLNEWLNRIDVLGQGPVHSITDIEIDDDSYQAPRFGKRNHAIYRGVFMNGDSSQGNLTELASATDWKSTSVGNDVAYMYSRFRATHTSSGNQDRYYTGEPMMRYHVKGRLIWDPRDAAQSSSDSTTWQWSDNPALCLLDYLTQPYGRNLDYSQLDIQSFIDAADSCDILVAIPSNTNETGNTISVWNPVTAQYEDVTPGGLIPNFRGFQIGTTQKRLTCNAALDPASSVLENVKILLQSMRGTLPYHNGTYSLKLEDVEPTSMSFNEDDIIGGVQFSQGDRSKRFNRTTVVFKNRNKKYKEDRVSWPALDSTEYATLLAEDNNEELFYEVGLDAVTDYYQAEDLAEFITMSSREQLSASMKVKSKAMLLEPGDVVEVTHQTPGWSSRKFRVRSVKVNTDHTVDLALTEYNASIYTWRDTSQEPLQEDIGLASPFDDKLPVTSLSATISRVDTASGVPQGQVELSFVSPEREQVREYIVRFKPTGTAVWIENKYPPTHDETTREVTASFLTPQHDTTYDLEVNYIDVAGIYGEAVISSFVIPEYRTDLDLDLNTIETEVGEILERESGGEFIPSDLSDLALYYKNSEITLQSNIDGVSTSLSGTDATVTALQSQLNSDVAALQQDVTDAESYTDAQVALLQGQVDGINTTIGDITASTADVYLQATAPVAGVSGVPDPIPANSRWYDSDDSNHPYVWDGSQWVSIKDGQTADNESRITDIEATVNNADSGVVATSTALDALDATVVALDGTVTSISGSVTDLQSTVNDPDSGVAANASAIDSLQTLTTTQGNTITSQSTAITELESRVEPTQTIYADDSVAGNVPNNATIGTALVTTATIPTGGLVGDGYLSLQLTNANSTEDVRVGYNGVEIGQFQSSGTDTDNQTLWFSTPVTITDGDQTIEVWNTPASALAITLDAVVIAVGGLGDPTTASATSGLSTRVTAAEGTITANADDISALQLTVNHPDTGVAATASAVSGLTATVEANEDGVAANAADISALELTVNDPDSGVAANAGAISGLTVRVTATEGQITSQASDITSLNADLSYRTEFLDESDDNVLGEDGTEFELENDPSAIASASAQANQVLDVRVTATEQEIDSQSVDITTLQSRATDVETGVAGNASALTALTTRVTTNEGDITAQASDISALQADITDPSTGLLANANALSGLTLRVTNTENDISANVQDITALETAVSDPTTGLAANSSAITALDSRVAVNEGDINAQSTDITALQNTVDNPETGVAATSTALTALDARVLVTENAIASSSSDITTLQNQIAPASLVHSSGPIDELVDAASSNLTGLIYNFTPAGDVPLGTGYLHVLIDGADTDDDFRIGYNGTEVGNAQVDSTQNNNSEQWFTFAVLTTTGQQTVTVWNPAATAGHVKGIILTYGGVGDPEGMFRGDANVAEISANSEAVTSLQSAVFAEDGTTVAWSSDITSLNNAITGDDGLESRINTLETADPDMVVFRQDDEPTEGLVVGALWVDTDDNNKLYMHDGSEWQAVDDARIGANSTAVSALESTVYAEDGVTAAWSSDITALNNAITDEGGINSRLTSLETAPADMVVFNQADEPTTTVVGALWIDSDDDNNLYTWDGEQWVNGTPQIDGMTVFYQADEPTTDVVGALWFDTDNNFSSSVWDGEEWQSVEDPRIGSNSTAITGLNSAVFAEDGETVAWSSDITALQATVNNEETGVDANATAISGLETLTTNQGLALNSQSLQITELESKATPAQTIHTAEGLAGAVPDNAELSTALVTTATIATGGLVGPGYLSIQLTNANSTEDVRVGYNGVEIGPVQSETTDTDNQTLWFSVPVVITDGDQTIELWNEVVSTLDITLDSVVIAVGGLGDPVSASATSGLSTRVTTTEDNITSLESQYYVQTNVNGHVSSIVLYNTGATSSFTVTADQFSVVAPYVEGEEPTAAAPFSVDTAGTISMNASVTIDGNLLVDGTITQLQMGNGSVGGDQIINGSVGANELEISADSDGTGERMFFNGTDNRIEIYDGSEPSVLRVALGNLTGI